MSGPGPRKGVQAERAVVVGVLLDEPADPEHPLDEIGMPSDPLWRYDAHLGKMASQGVHKHCSLADQ